MYKALKGFKDGLFLKGLRRFQRLRNIHPSPVD